MSDVVNSRELALTLWVVLLIGFLLWKKATRRSVLGLLKLAASLKLATIFVLMAVYVAAVVLSLHAAGLWARGQVPETILWVFGPGLVLLFSYDKIIKDPRFFRRAALSAVGLTVAIEFLVNLYPFHLVWELLLVPVFVALIGMQTVAATRAEYKPVGKVIQVILAIVGILFLTNGLAHIVSDPAGFTTKDNLRDFIVPIVLTIAFLPFIYCFSVFATYEQVFVRIGWQINDAELTKHTKRQMTRRCKLRLSRVNRFATEIPRRLGGVHDRDEMDALLKEIAETPVKASR